MKRSLLRAKLKLGLSAKVLLFTITFAVLAEILIVLPSLANFRRDWLMERVITSQIASLALEASEKGELPPKLRAELLSTAGVHAVSLKRPKMRQLVLGLPENETVSDVYDLRQASILTLMRDGLAALFTSEGRAIRVIGSPAMMPDVETDIVLDETPLKAALWTFLGNIFWMSVLFSVLVSVPIYLALNLVLVRPVMLLSQAMTRYREKPEDPSRIIVPPGRTDEIGTAEQELHSLQTQLSEVLREKLRLANIGLAVSKINHDLRNMLASAQLVSDRLTVVDDPTVQRFAPRLMRALDRAIALCSETLKYGRTSELPPKPARFALLPLLREVREGLGVDEHGPPCLVLKVPADLEVWADRDQLYRVLTNLTRNAIEALKNGALANGLIEIEAARNGESIAIFVRDNGPGLPPKIKADLFKPFQSGSGANGTGLGLAISAELVRAHGGDIVLEEVRAGTSFLITLPWLAQDGQGGLKSARG